MEFSYTLEGDGLVVGRVMTRKEVLEWTRGRNKLKIKSMFLVGGCHDEYRQSRARREYENEQKAKARRAHIAYQNWFLGW